MSSIWLTIGYFYDASAGWLGQSSTNKRVICSFALTRLSHLSRYTLITGLTGYEPAQLKHISCMLDFALQVPLGSKLIGVKKLS